MKARKVRYDVNTDDLFLGDSIDEATRLRVIKSDAGSIILALHKVLEGDLKCSLVDYEAMVDMYKDLAKICRVWLCTAEGLTLGYIAADNLELGNAARAAKGKRDNKNKITYFTESHGMAAPSENRTYDSGSKFASVNPKYIANKILNPNAELHKTVTNSYKSVKYAYEHAVHDSYKSLHKRIEAIHYKNKSDTFDLGIKTTTKLLEGFGVSIKEQDIPTKDYLKIMEARNLSLQKKQQRENTAKEMKEFFDKDKWIIAMNISGGIIVGAISYAPLHVVIDNWVEEESHLRHATPEHNGGEHRYSEVIVPFKWYPSLDALPEDMRKDIVSKMVMMDVHRNDGMTIRDPKLEKKAIEPYTSYYDSTKALVCKELGALTLFRHNQSHIVVLDK